MCASFGWVPGWQASHEMPSAPNSFSPQGSQNVDEFRKVHWLPSSHGFSVHVATKDALVQTAPLDSSAGLSMVVLVMVLTTTEAILAARLTTTTATGVSSKQLERPGALMRTLWVFYKQLPENVNLSNQRTGSAFRFGEL